MADPFTYKHYPNMVRHVVSVMIANMSPTISTIFTRERKSRSIDVYKNQTKTLLLREEEGLYIVESVFWLRRSSVDPSDLQGCNFDFYLNGDTSVTCSIAAISSDSTPTGKEYLFAPIFSKNAIKVEVSTGNSYGCNAQIVFTRLN